MLLLERLVDKLARGDTGRVKRFSANLRERLLRAVDAGLPQAETARTTASLHNKRDTESVSQNAPTNSPDQSQSFCQPPKIVCHRVQEPEQHCLSFLHSSPWTLQHLPPPQGALWGQHTLIVMSGCPSFGLAHTFWPGGQTQAQSTHAAPPAHWLPHDPQS